MAETIQAPTFEAEHAILLEHGLAVMERALGTEELTQFGIKAVMVTIDPEAQFRAVAITCRNGTVVSLNSTRGSLSLAQISPRLYGEYGHPETFAPKEEDVIHDIAYLTVGLGQK